MTDKTDTQLTTDTQTDTNTQPESDNQAAVTTEVAAEPVVEAEPVTEAEPVVEPVVEPEVIAETGPVVAPEPAEEAVEPVLETETVVEPVVEPEPAAEPEPTATPVAEPVQVPDNTKWYVIHTYSGHENKVSATLKQRVETMQLQERIFDIVVPTRNIVTVKHGKKEEQKEKIFPGYILVKMVLDDETWLAVRTTQGVTAFVGAGTKPTPISEKEVQTIIKFMELEAPKYKATFSVGEAVKIVDGPFADFLGSIDSIDEAKGKIKVLVSIFGRETPVELDFLQVTKL